MIAHLKLWLPEGIQQFSTHCWSLGAVFNLHAYMSSPGMARSVPGVLAEAASPSEEAIESYMARAYPGARGALPMRGVVLPISPLAKGVAAQPIHSSQNNQ